MPSVRFLGPVAPWCFSEFYSIRIGPDHIRHVSVDALASTARAVPVWNERRALVNTFSISAQNISNAWEHI